jgi:hypothetical protein
VNYITQAQDKLLLNCEPKPISQERLCRTNPAGPKQARDEYVYDLLCIYQLLGFKAGRSYHVGPGGHFFNFVNAAMAPIDKQACTGIDDVIKRVLAKQRKSET